MGCCFATSATGVDMVDDELNKYKKRMRRLCCCGGGWVFVGLLIFVSGVALLVKYADVWGDTDTWKRHLAYTGAAFIAIAIGMLAVGILLCVFVCMLYRRATAGSSTAKPADMPKYAPGDAPYPQQKYVQSPQGAPPPTGSQAPPSG